MVHRALDRAVGALEPGRARAARELGDRDEPEHVAALEQHWQIVGRASLLGDRAREHRVARKARPKVNLQGQSVALEADARVLVLEHTGKLCELRQSERARVHKRLER